MQRSNRNSRRKTSFFQQILFWTPIMSWALSHWKQKRDKVPICGAYNLGDNLNLSFEVIIYSDLDDDSLESQTLSSKSSICQSLTVWYLNKLDKKLFDKFLLLCSKPCNKNTDEGKNKLIMDWHRSLSNE